MWPGIGWVVPGTPYGSSKSCRRTSPPRPWGPGRAQRWAAQYLPAPEGRRFRLGALDSGTRCSWLITVGAGGRNGSDPERTGVLPAPLRPDVMTIDVRILESNHGALLESLADGVSTRNQPCAIQAAMMSASRAMRDSGPVIRSFLSAGTASVCHQS